MEIQKINLTAGNVAQTFENIKEALENGTLSGTDVVALIKIFENNFKKVKDLCTELAIDEIGEQEYATHGVIMKHQRGRVIYDYSGSEKWTRLKKEIHVLEKQLQVGEVVDQDTGEIQPQALKKFSKDSIKVTFKKQ